MGHLRPRQVARIGMAYLEEAILEVLFEATKKGQSRKASSISKELGIPLCKARSNYPIVDGILHKLEEVEKRVIRFYGGSCRLTDEELKNWK